MFLSVVVVMSMGLWSEARSVTVFQVVLLASVGEQNVMSGDVALYSAWCGMCVGVVVLLRMKSSFNCSDMSSPRVLFCCSVYQLVCLAFMSPHRRTLSCVLSWLMLGL